MKLDRISSTGLFMTYKGTDKVMYVVNKHGKNERASAHVSFDKAHNNPVISHIKLDFIFSAFSKVGELNFGTTSNIAP